MKRAAVGIKRCTNVAGRAEEAAGAGSAGSNRTRQACRRGEGIENRHSAETENSGEREMTRISSRLTFVTKRVFPAMWIGIIAASFGATTFISARSHVHVPIQFWIIPLVMAGIGYFIMKNLVFDLADEVWDAGSELVVKNKGQEAHVAIADIVNVSYSVATNPQRVTLALRQPTAFGTEVTFAAPTTWVPFAKSPIIEELIKRVDMARGSRR
jgi:hypothetical protein